MIISYTVKGEHKFIYARIFRKNMKYTEIVAQCSLRLR